MEDAGKYIREANRSLAAREYANSCLAYCRALDLEPRHAHAHHNVGAILLMAGRAPEALPALLTAHDLDPDSALFAASLARGLLVLGETDRAVSLLDAAIATHPGETALQALRAPLGTGPTGGSRPPDSEAITERFALARTRLDQGEWKAAYDAGRSLIFLRPDDPALWRLLAESGQACATAEEAELSARRALALDPADERNWRVLCDILTTVPARLADAERVVRRAIAACGPRDVLVSHLFERLVRTGREDEALGLLDAATQGDGPVPAGLLQLHALALEQRGDIDAAAALFEDALARSPENRELVLAALAFYDRHLDPEAMLQLLNRAREAGLDFQTGEMCDAQARALRRAGRLEEARLAIARALELGGTADQRRSRLFTQARILDSQGAFAGAFDSADQANRLLELVWEERGPCDHTMALRRLDSLGRRLDCEIESGCPAVADSGDGPANIAFLIGFPRSGTTLLDSILRSHSLVEVLEEQPVLINALRAAEPGPSGDETVFTEGWLDRLEQADPARLRAHYIEHLSRHVGQAIDPGKVYVDKLPLNINWAALIHRIFPRAVFILALRHPFDVAVSNLLQDYRPNNAMLNMTRLSRIDAFYSQSFAFWERFEHWRRPRVVRVRYEALVDDLEAAIEPVMTALGLTLEPAQSRFFETARQRGRISTPSAEQVTRRLYTSSRERWRNYAFAFSGGTYPGLRAWAERLGYDLRD